MFHVILGLPWLLVTLRFIPALPWHWSIQVALAIVLLVASQYHLISRLSSGSVFSPEFARPLILAFNLLFGAMVLLAIFQLVLDALSLGGMVVLGHFPAVPAGVRYAMGATALLLAAVGVSQAIRVPPVKDIDIAVAGLPASFEGYRLVQLTDLHISRLFPERWADAVVSRTNALDADLIVITGDLIDGTLDVRRQDVAPLSRLRAADGVYVIPGNHEYFFGYEMWVRHFETFGMRPLENAHAVIARGAERIVIAGVTDVSATRTRFATRDLASAMRGAPAVAPVILLDHQPMNAREAAKAGVAVQLSGHTHGGMIVGLDRLFGLANNGFVSGFYDVGGMQLYVNNGTGLWPGFALRLGRPAELTRITLRRKP